MTDARRLEDMMSEYERMMNDHEIRNARREITGDARRGALNSWRIAPREDYEREWLVE